MISTPFLEKKSLELIIKRGCTTQNAHRFQINLAEVNSK